MHCGQFPPTLHVTSPSHHISGCIFYKLNCKGCDVHGCDATSKIRFKRFQVWVYWFSRCFIQKKGFDMAKGFRSKKRQKGWVRQKKAFNSYSRFSRTALSSSTSISVNWGPHPKLPHYISTLATAQHRKKGSIHLNSQQVSCHIFLKYRMIVL